MVAIAMTNDLKIIMERLTPLFKQRREDTVLDFTCQPDLHAGI